MIAFGPMGTSSTRSVISLFPLVFALAGLLSPPTLPAQEGPILVGTYTNANNFQGVDSLGDQIFAVTYGYPDSHPNARVRVFEGTSPPIQVAETPLKGARKVQGVGNYLFVQTMYWSESVSIWATGLHIFRRSTFERVAYAGYVGEGTSLYVANNVAYLGVPGRGLYLYDVSRLDSFGSDTILDPEYAGSHGPNYVLNVYTNVHYCDDLCVAGKYAYIADVGLLILDVSNPTQPVLVSKWNTPNQRSVDAVYHEGNRIYLAGSYFFILDVANPAEPKLLGEFPLAMSDPNGTTRVKVAHGYAYVAGDGGLAVLDVTDPAQPRHVGGFGTPYRAEDVDVDWPMIYLADRSGLYVLRHGETTQFDLSAGEGQVGEEVTLSGPQGFFPANPSNNKVVFIREIADQGTVEAPAEVIESASSTLRVRVPVGILGDRMAITRLPVDHGRETIRVRVTIDENGQQRTGGGDFVLILPWTLIYDMVVVPPAAPRRQILPQYPLANSNALQTFVFVGRSTDAQVALRVLNTTVLGIRPDGTTRILPPLRLAGMTEVYPPNSTTPLLPGSLPNLGLNNAGLSLSINADGLYLIIVRADATSEFPGPFQIHLAGNVGLPQKTNEPPRATRLDILFNQAAPRPQALLPPPNLTILRQPGAETALFKFVSSAEVDPFAVAAIIPPTPLGVPIIRASDPTNSLGITTPTARTPQMISPPAGTLLDFTQVPIPAAVNVAPLLSGLPAAALGTNDSYSATQSLILDMGSGSEIVDGPGVDLEVFATGVYAVSVGNTPFSPTLVPLSTGSGPGAFDLSVLGLNVARYVMITGTNITLDAVKGRHVFADRFQNEIGPLMDVGEATITMQRRKNANNTLDPFLELMGTDGWRLGENDSGFGDTTSLDYTDAALINIGLGTTGFYRFLGRGYNQMPDYSITQRHKFVGSFFVRLETGGDFNKDYLEVSPADELGTVPQRTGRITRVRQRDSYLLLGSPGELVNLTVDGSGATPLPDPLIEFYDPEGFLMAANDDYPGRGKNSVISLRLPATTGDATPLDSPQTYRIVVSGVDRPGGVSWVFPRRTECRAFQRAVNGGDYTLKVFRGALATAALAPQIQSIQPTTALPGAQVTILGTNFSRIAAENQVRFAGVQAAITEASPTRIVATVPPGLTAGTVTVTVTVGGQSSNAVAYPIAGTVLAQADVSLLALSLEVPPATALVNGKTYTFSWSTSSDPGTVNGELACTLPLNTAEDLMRLGLDEVYYSHSTVATLTDPQGRPRVTGSLALDVPPARDADTNGIPDFYQVSRAVSAEDSIGMLDHPAGPDLVFATWDRAAGSLTGRCHLTLWTQLDQASVDLDFNLEFHLVEYRGTLAYERQTNVNIGLLNLELSPGSPIKFARALSGIAEWAWQNQDDLRLSSGVWRNDQGADLNYESAKFSRHREAYHGILRFVESTQSDGFRAWILELLDSGDGDQDGIPNFSDEDFATGGMGAPDIRGYGLSTDRSEFWVSVLTQTNRWYWLERSYNLTNWTAIQSPIMGDGNVRVIPDPQPVTSSRRFFRVGVKLP